MKTIIRRKALRAVHISALPQATQRRGTPWVLVGDNPLRLQDGALVYTLATWGLPETQKFVEGRDSDVQFLSCLGQGARLIASTSMAWPNHFQDAIVDVVE